MEAPKRIWLDPCSLEDMPALETEVAGNGDVGYVRADIADKDKRELLEVLKDADRILRAVSKQIQDAIAKVEDWRTTHEIGKGAPHDRGR